MQYVLTVTTPIYLLIAVGFFAVFRGWMMPPDMRTLGRFVAQFCVPALLFRAISRQPLGAVLNADYLGVYAAGSLTAMALVTWLAWRGRAGRCRWPCCRGWGRPGQTAPSSVTPSCCR